LKDLLFIVAISPAKAGHFQTIQPSQYLIISSLKPQARLINLYTLGKAQAA